MNRDEIEWRKKWLAFWLGHVTKVEPAIGSTIGAPDVILENAPFYTWVEFKVADDEGNFCVRTPQVRWHAKYLQAGNKTALFVVMDKEGWWLFPSSVVVNDKVRIHNVYRLSGKKVTWHYFDGEDAPHFALQDMLSRAVQANG